MKQTPGTSLMDILSEAASIVGGARHQDYGTPLANHQRTADLWNAYLRCSPSEKPQPLTPRDVCMLNILQKVSRDRHAPKRDNLVDIAGYARNAELCEPQPEQPAEIQPQPHGHDEAGSWDGKHDSTYRVVCLTCGAERPWGEKWTAPCPAVDTTAKTDVD